MPMIKGRRADVVIGSSSIIKRETVSQLLEGCCGYYAEQRLSGDEVHTVSDVINKFGAEYRVRGSVTDSILKWCKGEVTVGGVNPKRNVMTMKSDYIVGRVVKANFGVIRLAQSCFLASLRMSCTATKAGVNTMKPSVAVSEGGSKTLGEMECMQLRASGLLQCRLWTYQMAE